MNVIANRRDRNVEKRGNLGIGPGVPVTEYNASPNVGPQPSQLRRQVGIRDHDLASCLRGKQWTTIPTALPANRGLSDPIQVPDGVGHRNQLSAMLPRIDHGLAS